MCLILIAHGAHSEYPLVIAANRDEYYQRPTARAAFWQDHPHILAGRDLECMGTWLGVEWYKMTDVLSASSKRQGAIWGQGALGYAHGNPNIPVGAGSAVRPVNGNQSVFVEIQRDASGGLSEIVGNSYIGVAIIEQSRGYGLITSAT